MIAKAVTTQGYMWESRDVQKVLADPVTVTLVTSRDKFQSSWENIREMEVTSTRGWNDERH